MRADEADIDVSLVRRLIGGRFPRRADLPVEPVVSSGTENALARRFYEKAGFAPDGAEASFDVRGVAVPGTRYARRLSAADAAAVSRG